MKIYMIGIGGSSMSFLARMLEDMGHTVSGSDKTGSDITEALSAHGIAVHIGHDESVAGAEAVVYTGGVAGDNPQLTEARAAHIPIFERSEMLGLLSLEYRRVIAVAGTHGKTTTAAMIALLLRDSDPTLHIGAEGSFLGSKDTLVTEACEYRNSFLTLKPDCSVVLNIECDHPDFYHTPESLAASFAAFTAKTRDGGLILVEENASLLIKDKRALTFGKHGDYSYRDVAFDGARASYDAYFHETHLGRVELGLDGAQWIEDSLAAVAVATEYGIDWETVAERIALFKGVKRRGECVGVWNGAKVILDYAHHPTQIRAAIDTVHRRGKRAVVVFQPHTYSRTKALWRDFIASLEAAESVVLTDIYAAREKDDGSVSSFALTRSLAFRGMDAVYAPSFEAAVKRLELRVTPDTELLVLGAGNIANLVQMLPDITFNVLKSDKKPE